MSERVPIDSVQLSEIKRIVTEAYKIVKESYKVGKGPLSKDQFDKVMVEIDLLNLITSLPDPGLPSDTMVGGSLFLDDLFEAVNYDKDTMDVDNDDGLDKMEDLGRF